MLATFHDGGFNYPLLVIPKCLAKSYFYPSFNNKSKSDILGILLTLMASR
ncbi:hypothetical protein EW14_1524 [Prochlorococcus sp. MIT 0604]|nr:hypothetical protein EW14_1524 [Prochlorococcus sp. MIT 0604]